MRGGETGIGLGKTAATLAERLDRLAAEIDRNRIDLHVPGAALAIVRGDEVIFARGFGVADVEKMRQTTRVPPSRSGEVKDMDEARLEPACLPRGLGRKCGVTAGETHQAITKP